MKEFYIDPPTKISKIWAEYKLGGSQSPIMLHNSMFRLCLELLTDDEQKEKYLDLALKQRIHGTYVQTEIGHGSDISSLQTTATYDIKTDEFVIHTPTIEATKWWPGDLGLHSSHAIVFA